MMAGNMSAADPCLAIHLIMAVSGEASATESYTTNISHNMSHITSASSNDTLLKTQDYTDMDLTHNTPDSGTEMFKYYLSGIVNPILCAFGLLGNILNIIVLTRRRMQTAMDCPMEKAAQLGLIALAVSDMLYCVSAIPDAFISRSQTVFQGRTFWLYVQIYGPYFQNVFMQTSTWLTVLMATGRYAAICRPLHARYLVEVKGTRVAIALVFVIWILLELPLLWEYLVVDLNCPPNNTAWVFVVDGFFVRQHNMKKAFMYIWSILGYFIPVVILIYCNAHLISALKSSYRMRKLYRVHSKAADPGAHITPTLIAIVCAFLILVSPSEIIHFYYYTIDNDQVEAFNVAIVITNVLQHLNFSLNFLLYCVVNAHFRDTWKGMMYCIWHRGDYMAGTSSRRGAGYTHGTGGTLSSAAATVTTTTSNGKSLLSSATDLDVIHMKMQPSPKL